MSAVSNLLFGFVGSVSHGCVRLSVKNAATLWKLVKQEKMANTKALLSGATPDGGPAARARPLPLPLNADNPADGEPPPQRQPQQYNGGPPPLPFPFSIFGR